ncbi:hypothetical protein [Enterococcus pernyi]|uniref:hypothetical protein n=1 Tax=Enterococcus pernyi TaxID=590158 RepID=UPI000789B564|nr:hypothetical protein [Enterococcus pernyi]
MNRLNKILVLITPFTVYLLSLQGRKQASIGIVYLAWMFLALNEADYSTNKRHDHLNEASSTSNINYTNLYFKSY